MSTFGKYECIKTSFLITSDIYVHPKIKFTIYLVNFLLRVIIHHKICLDLSIVISKISGINVFPILKNLDEIDKVVGV